MIRNELVRLDGAITAEVIDLDAGTVTIEEMGKPVSARPLTADERAQWTPTTPVATPDEKLAAARQALAALGTITAPVLPADLVDILTDVATALED